MCSVKEFIVVSLAISKTESAPPSLRLFHSDKVVKTAAAPKRLRFILSQDLPDSRVPSHARDREKRVESASGEGRCFPRELREEGKQWGRAHK